MKRILPRSFYVRDPATVARELLGKEIVRVGEDELLRGTIVETEAYLATLDEAAHGFRGKDERNHSLFGDAGHAYVHTMRQHALLDIVTEGVGVPSSVLIRGVEPLTGVRLMQERRGVENIANLANGPGKFCQAFAITKALDGIDVTSATSPLYVTEGDELVRGRSIEVSARIGISRSKEEQLRFCLLK